MILQMIALAVALIAAFGLFLLIMLAGLVIGAISILVDHFRNQHKDIYINIEDHQR